MDVTYTVHPQDAWELWDSMRQVDTTEDSISIDEVTGFINGLQAHFFRHFRIDLSAGSLMQISTALGSSHHGGKIKVDMHIYGKANISSLNTSDWLFVTCNLHFKWAQPHT